METQTQTTPKKTFDLKKSLKHALGGGTAGAMAMGCQVLSLMWLRTTMNYQYRHGTTTTQALRHLYREGGIIRFYRGLGPALIQGPLSRFGDTAANAFALHFLDSNETTRKLPTSVKTATASVSAGLFRILLMPVDTFKTIMQVEGKQGIPILIKKFRTTGPSVFFYGAAATFTATAVGHFPWFFTFNKLQELIPVPAQDQVALKLMRNGLIGFTASVVSDTCSNSIRVLKVYRQTNATKVSYWRSAQEIVKAEGLIGLFGRGLKTRILTNGMQGLLFSILWKFFQETLSKK
jgi:hypothetical protein